MPVLRFLFSKDSANAQALSSKNYGVGQWFSDQYQSFISWFGALAKGEPFTALAYLCIALVIITVMKNGFRFLAMNFMVLIRNRSIQEIRQGVYQKCLDLPIAYFNNERKGDLMSRMSNDIKEIEFALIVSFEAFWNSVSAFLKDMSSDLAVPSERSRMYKRTCGDLDQDSAMDLPSEFHYF